MAINFNTQILSLYGASVASDAAYQSPGTYGLPASYTGAGGVGQIIIGGTNNAYTSAPTFSVSDSGSTGSGFTGTVYMKMATAAINAAGTGYAPGDKITLTFGTPVSASTKSILNVVSVKLISASIVAGGTGYGNAQTFNVTVAGGTAGTAAVISVTSDAGGAVVTVNSVGTAGSYTVLPANIATNAATGGTGTGLTLALVWGVNAISVSTPGQYTAVATTATQASTTGSGTGFTSQTQTFSVDSVLITAAGTNYSGTLTGTFSAGNATAQVYPDASNKAEERILTLIDVVQSFVGSAGNVEEVQVARDILWRMLSRINTGGPVPSLSDIATATQKAGVVKFSKRLRGSF